MAVSWVVTSAIEEENGSAPAAITPGTGTANGDLLIWVHYTNADTGTESVTPPTGFTSIFNANSSGFGLIAAAWRIRQSGDTSYTASVANHLSGTSGDAYIEHIITLRGHDPATPVGSVTASNSTWASSLNLGSIAAPASTSVAAGNAVFVFGGRRENVTGQTALTGDSLTWSTSPGTGTTNLGRDAGTAYQLGVNNTGSAQTATAKTITSTGTAQAGAGRMFIVNAAPSQNFTRTVDDNLGITDTSVTSTVGFNIVVNNPLGLSDAGEQKALAATGNEPLNLTDAVNAQLTGGGAALTRTVDDNLGLTDTTAVAVAYARSQDDPAGLTDTTSVSTAGAGARTVDDPLGLTDTAAAAAGHARTRDDPLGLADTAAPAAGFARTVTDNLGLTDAASTQLTGGGFTRTVADTLGLSDAGAPQQIDIAETLDNPLGLTDTVAVVTTHARTVTDNLGLTDTTSASTAGAGTRTVDDALGLTDTAAQVTVSARQVDDPAGLTDTASPATAFARTAADNLGFTDSVSTSTAAEQTRTITDNLGLTDARALARELGPTDNLGLTDAAALVATWARPVDDLLGLTDAAGQVAVSARAQTDALGLTDTVSAQLLSTTDQSRTDLLGLTDTIVFKLKTIRPDTGRTTRPGTGTTARPFAGTTVRP